MTKMMKEPELNVWLLAPQAKDVVGSIKLIRYNNRSSAEKENRKIQGKK